MSNYDKLVALSDSNPAADSITLFLSEVLNGGISQLLQNAPDSYFETESHLQSVPGQHAKELFKMLRDKQNMFSQYQDEAGRLTAEDEWFWEGLESSELIGIENWLYAEGNVEGLCGEILAALGKTESKVDSLVSKLLEQAS